MCYGESSSQEILVSVTRWAAPSATLLLALQGCTPSSFLTLPIYESPNAVVRLAVDRSLGSEFSHPATLSTDQIAAALAGIIVKEPATRMPVYDDLSIPRSHRAFSDEEVAFWAPLLTIGLSKATPEEVVTFYRTTRRSNARREVTSGGIFVREDELHILLRNYRSETQYFSDFGAADTGDDRLTPLRPLAPQRGALDFEPTSARRTTKQEGMRELLEWDPRELIVLYKELPADAEKSPRPTPTSRPAGPPDPAPAGKR
jgi:hypothetical protein